ncbi:MAG: hypothetical protein H8E96_03015, partial [Verrucomicrobiaceae bacterium]|nr:hypothetical protein [Verrucomicrobiaceae bacterium]
MKKTIATISLAALSILSVQAASISSAGTIVGLTPPGNGVGTDVADLDAAGAGTDGFVLFNSIAEGGNQGGVPWAQAIVDSSPAYITNLDGLASTSSGGWANYDDVLVGGTQYNTGGIQAAGIGAGVEAALFTFELSGSVPAALKGGVYADSLQYSVCFA